MVWRWNVLENVGKDVYSTFKPSGLRDFSHCNAIAFDRHRQDYEAIYLSCRALSRVFKIDRATGTILWAFGGDAGLTGTFPFDLDGNADVYFQHAPEITPDGTILVYDNGNNRPEGRYSRTVEIAVDEEARTANVIWEYVHDAYSDAVGDADLQPGGTILHTNMLGPLLEISRFPTRKEWEVDWDHPLYIGYNAQRVPGLY